MGPPAQLPNLGRLPLSGGADAAPRREADDPTGLGLAGFSRLSLSGKKAAEGLLRRNDEAETGAGLGLKVEAIATDIGRRLFTQLPYFGAVEVPRVTNNGQAPEEGLYHSGDASNQKNGFEKDVIHLAIAGADGTLGATDDTPRTPFPLPSSLGRRPLHIDRTADLLWFPRAEETSLLESYNERFVFSTPGAPNALRNAPLILKDLFQQQFRRIDAKYLPPIIQWVGSHAYQFLNQPGGIRPHSNPYKSLLTKPYASKGADGHPNMRRTMVFVRKEDDSPYWCYGRAEVVGIEYRNSTSGYFKEQKLWHEQFTCKKEAMESKVRRLQAEAAEPYAASGKRQELLDALGELREFVEGDYAVAEGNWRNIASKYQGGELLEPIVYLRLTGGPTYDTLKHQGLSLFEKAEEFEEQRVSALMETREADPTNQYVPFPFYNTKRQPPQDLLAAPLGCP